MNTPQEIDLIQSTIISNRVWLDLIPAVKEHLFGSDYDNSKGNGNGVFAQLKKEYFTDRSKKYPAFLADILALYYDLYEESLPCVTLQDEKALAEHREAIKHFRIIDKYLVDKGDIEFSLLVNGNYFYVTLIRVWDNKHTKYVEWKTGKANRVVQKAEKSEEIIGHMVIFEVDPWMDISEWIKKYMGNVPINGINKDDPHYDEIRNMLRKELAILIGDGYATIGHHIKEFAELCKPLDAKIKEHLPDSTNKERASIILRLFDINADDKKFAELLNPPQPKEDN